MIAHRIQRSSGKDSFGRLGCYVLDLKSPTDPRAFERLATYVADQNGHGNVERVIGARITNCEFGDDLEDAIREIERVQARNQRTRMDKSYHLVVSFREGERPSAEQLRDIEDHLVASIGYGEHQRISAIHDDTDNLHIHVAINKIHPQTFRAFEPHFDKKKLMAACRELELKHGLALDHHGLPGDRDSHRLPDPAAKMEVHGGRQSLASWIESNVRDQLVEAAGAAPTWSAFHAQLHELGLTLRPRGAGFVVGALGTDTHVKASSIDRMLSLQMLTGRLGAYQPPPIDRVRPEPTFRYEPELKKDQRTSATLYRQFQLDREQALAARNKALGELSDTHRVYAHQLAAHYRLERRRLSGTPYLAPALRKQLLDQHAVNQIRSRTQRRDLAQRQRQEVRNAHPVPQWQDFLEQAAAGGDQQALSILRARAASGRHAHARGDTLQPTRSEDVRHVVYPSPATRVLKNGDVVYDLPDGGKVTDRASEVQADRLTSGSAFLALSLATERFGSQPLCVTGSEAFKAAVINEAVAHGIVVTFADPDMEHSRLVALSLAQRGRGLAAGDTAGRDVSRFTRPSEREGTERYCGRG